MLLLMSHDTDGDGLTNAIEISLGTNPNLRDSDSDGLPDGWEVSRNLDPTSDSTDFIEEMNSFGYSPKIKCRTQDLVLA